MIPRSLMKAVRDKEIWDIDMVVDSFDGAPPAANASPSYFVNWQRGGDQEGSTSLKPPGNAGRVTWGQKFGFSTILYVKGDGTGKYMSRNVRLKVYEVTAAIKGKEERRLLHWDTALPRRREKKPLGARKVFEAVADAAVLNKKLALCGDGMKLRVTFAARSSANSGSGTRKPSFGLCTGPVGNPPPPPARPRAASVASTSSSFSTVSLRGGEDRDRDRDSVSSSNCSTASCSTAEEARERFVEGAAADPRDVARVEGLVGEFVRQYGRHFEEGGACDRRRMPHLHQKYRAMQRLAEHKQLSHHKLLMLESSLFSLEDDVDEFLPHSAAETTPSEASTFSTASQTDPMEPMVTPCLQEKRVTPPQPPNLPRRRRKLQEERQENRFCTCEIM